MKRRPYSYIALALELVLTLCVFIAVVILMSTTVRNDANRYVSDIQTDYQNLEVRYTSVFKAMTVHVGEEIAADPTFDEMNAWLQSHDSLFSDAVGSSIYDGFAMTYKGGYAHSWNYGDYSNYDPNTRIWYREAQAANGRVTVVAPYVTYVGGQFPNSDQYIEMSVVQKYSDSISFDLDLKIYDVTALLKSKRATSTAMDALLFDDEGYILSTTDSSLYCHNINDPDDVLSSSMSNALLSLKGTRNTLRFMNIDGRFKVAYAIQDAAGNTYCVMFPFGALFVQYYLFIVLIMILLILLEVEMYRRNDRRLRELEARDRRIAEIAQLGFSYQLHVDVATMRCIFDDEMPDTVDTDDYGSLFAYLRGKIPDVTARAEFESLLAPDALRMPEAAALASGKFRFTFTAKARDTSPETYEISRFVSDIDGKKTAVILGNDVTDEERSQRQLLRAVAHRYSVACVGNTETGRIDIIKTDSYLEAIRAPGVTANDLQERFAHAYMKDGYIRNYLDAVSCEVIADRLSRSDGYSLTVQYKDEHWYCFRFIRDQDFEENHRFIFLVENVDDQMNHQAELEHALDEAKSSDRAKSDFLSRMSHDIRTPLNGIIGMTYIANEQPNPPGTVECLERIGTSSKFLLGLVNDVLDMSKAESDKIEFYPEPYPIGDLENYLDAVIRPLCVERRQDFVVDIRAVAGVTPCVDTLRLNQIFFNLLSNAVKYTPEGGTITLRLDEEMTEDDRLLVHAEVIDTGVGMSEAFQQVVFEPFSQEGRSDVSERRGSGLGLAIVKKMVDLMGGTISVRSKIGEGTAFIVDMLLDCVPTEGTSEKNGTVGDTDLAVLEGMHVLLCEDHPINQEIARTLLTERGMMVELAEDGQKSVDLFKLSSIGYYDVILMDIRMPIMDGYEATRQIRALDRPDARTVPIVAMTADAFSDDIRRCLDAGMDGHIAKPIDPESLYATIAEMMGHAHGGHPNDGDG